MPQNQQVETTAENDNNSPVTKISTLLSEASIVQKEQTEVKVFDYYSLFDAMMQKEFNEELQRLQSFIESPEQFIEKFRSACAERNDSKNVFNFHEYPDSPTNKLYKEIAVLLFPENPLSVLMPGLKKFYRTELPDAIDFKENRLTGTLANPNVIPVKSGIAHYTPPLLEINPNDIDVDKLSACVVSGSILFDVASLKTLTLLPFQCNFHNFLRDKWPELTERIYNHNGDLRQLKAKIDFINKPKTPLQALKNLINGLQLGGTAMTSKKYASLTAQHAYLYFLDYLKLLPQATLTELGKLGIKNSKTSFQSVLEDLRLNNCVETAANNLELIIAENRNNPILNVLPSRAETNKIAQQRHFTQEIEGLDVTRSYLGVQVFPVRWFDEIIQEMKLEDDSELLYLLILNFPNSVLHALLNRFINNVKYIDKLEHALRLNLFDAHVEKKEIIVAFLADEILKTTPWEKYLIRAQNARIPDIFKLILHRYRDKISAAHKQDLIREYKLESKYLSCIFEILLEPKERKQVVVDNFADFLVEENVLHETLGRLDFSLKELKDFLNIEINADSGSSFFWDFARRNGTHFANLLHAIPEQWRWSLMQEKNPLQVFAPNWSAGELYKLLMLLPEKDRDSAIKYLLRSCKDLFYLLGECADLLGLFLPYLEQNSCTEVMKGINPNGLVGLARKPAVLSALLNKYDKNERWGVLQKLKSPSGNNVLHLVGNQNANSLPGIIDLLPQEKHSDALMLDSKDAGTVLGYAVEAPQFVREFFRNEKNQHLFSLQHKTKTILEIILKYSTTLDALLEVIPAEKRLPFLLGQESASSDPIIHKVNFIWGGIIQVLFKYFPEEEDRKQLVRSCNKLGQNFLYNTTMFLDELKMLLPYCSLAMLRQHDQNGNTLLHHFTANRRGLKKIFSHFSKNEQKDLLQVVNRDNQTLIEYAISKNICMTTKWLLSLIPENDRLAYLQNLPNVRGRNIWQQAFYNSERLFEVVMNSLPPAHCLTAVLEKNINGVNLLSKLFEHSTFYDDVNYRHLCFFDLVKILPPDDLFVLWQNIPRTNQISLLKNENILTKTLSRLPPQKRLEFLFVGNGQEDALIHQLKPNITQLKKIIEALPEGDRKKVCTSRDSKGQTLLHKMAANVEALQVLKPYYSLADINSKDDQEKDVLCYALSNSAAYKYIIDNLSADEKNELISKDFETLLRTQYPYNDADILKCSLELIPEAKRFNILQNIKFYSGQDIWQQTIGWPKLFTVAMQCLPEKDRLAAVMRLDEFGRTLIGQIYPTQEKHKENLVTIIALLPAKDVTVVWQQILDNLDSWTEQTQHDFLIDLSAKWLGNIDKILIKSSPGEQNLKQSNLLDKIAGESLFIKAQVLSDTFRLLDKNSKAKTVEEKQSNMKDYVGRLNSIPDISPFTKKLCIALAISVVGILPAVIIWSVSRLNFFKRTNDIIGFSKEISDSLPLTAPVSS